VRPVASVAATAFMCVLLRAPGECRRSGGRPADGRRPVPGPDPERVATERCVGPDASARGDPPAGSTLQGRRLHPMAGENRPRSPTARPIRRQE
jgi:hypothetical protein